MARDSAKKIFQVFPFTKSHDNVSAKRSSIMRAKFGFQRHVSGLAIILAMALMPAPAQSNDWISEVLDDRCSAESKQGITDSVRDAIESSVRRAEAAIQAPSPIGDLSCLTDLMEMPLDTFSNIGGLLDAFESALPSLDDFAIDIDVAGMVCGFAAKKWGELTQPLNEITGFASDFSLENIISGSLDFQSNFLNNDRFPASKPNAPSPAYGSRDNFPEGQIAHRENPPWGSRGETHGVENGENGEEPKPVNTILDTFDIFDRNNPIEPIENDFTEISYIDDDFTNARNDFVSEMDNLKMLADYMACKLNHYDISSSNGATNFLNGSTFTRRNDSCNFNFSFPPTFTVTPESSSEGQGRLQIIPQNSREQQAPEAPQQSSEPIQSMQSEPRTTPTRPVPEPSSNPLDDIWGSMGRTED